MTRTRKKIPQGRFSACIETLSHDGRGIARLDGKAVFIENALPGETVTFEYRQVSSRFDEGRAVDWPTPAPTRVAPPCAHAAVCGGCSLQHLAPAAQLAQKQDTLAEQLQHFGHLQPQRWLAPLAGPALGYRSKARLGVKHVAAKGLPLVGFREKGGRYLTDMHYCPVLEAPLHEAIEPLRQLMAQLDIKDRLPQIEVAKGDEEVALVFRHLDPLGESDRQKLLDFCRERGWQCWLQPGNETTTHRIWPTTGTERLHYAHPDFGLRLAFHPQDFTQVNRVINRAMVKQAIGLLEVDTGHRVLDLFCGLGNFTLPLARLAREVVGVEGGAAMVERGLENARANAIANASFHAWDLTRDAAGQAWAAGGFERILVDPPRAGALEVIPWLVKLKAERLVYVSCNPATLARDAGELAKQGYRLEAAGVMDMFPHTTHVESMALFLRQ